MSSSESEDDGPPPADITEERQQTDKTFKDLGLVDTLCEQCQALGWKKPTKIQVEAIPIALDGKDVIGLAETGSGKTGAASGSLRGHSPGSGPERSATDPQAARYASPVQPGPLWAASAPSSPRPEIPLHTVMAGGFPTGGQELHRSS